MEAERISGQLDRILSSAAFGGAERARKFLRFIVTYALQGRLGEIKESIIAVEAFGRNPSFDPKSDPIVRVEARRLRERLSSYYADEGRADTVLISLPKGGYIPEFSERRTSDESRLRPRRALQQLVYLGFLGITLAVLALVYLRNPKKPAESAGTLRLSILPPEGTTFESFVVSPDGRRLAFTSAWNGQSMLWVRSLDSLDAKLLAGTEFAQYPFWSPDNRLIGFFTASKLKVVDIAGGPARDVADVVAAGGGAWSAAGIILFCPRPIGGLYQVSVSGGAPRPVTSLDPARGEVAHILPQFLPDGRHFLYLAASSRPGESSIRMGSLDSQDSKVLLSADTSAAYAPVLPGHSSSLLFVSDGSLLAQPFDPTRAVLSGARTVLVPQIRYQRWHQPGFSVSSNGVLLYQSGSAEDRQLAWFDRRGRLLQTIGPRNSYEAFNLSPDQTSIAIVRNDDPATIMPTIWIMDLSRQSAVSRLSGTGVAEANFSPVWSPDGRELLFSTGTERRMRLLVGSPNGGPAKTVLDTDGPKFPTDWSSDGRFVSFNSQWPDYEYMHAWTVSLSNPGQPRPLQHSWTELSAYFAPADSGNGPRWIAYASDETGREEVYVRDFPDGVRKWRVSTEGGALPHWQRDGKELFYLALDGTLMALAVKPGFAFEAGSPHALFNSGLLLTPSDTVMNLYAVARDGQRFLFNTRIPETSPGAITAVIPW